jgi:hypothetical protein
MSELSQGEIDRIAAEAAALADAGDREAAWTVAAPLREHLQRQTYAAISLLHLANRRTFAAQHSLDAVRAVSEAHASDDEMLGVIGSALEAAHDVSFLNGPPPSDPLFAATAERLSERLDVLRGSENETLLASGLATVGRLLGPRWDAQVERAARRLVELRPRRWQDQYDLGLFFKVRGRFAEGVEANERAAALGGGDADSVCWNLGICATGAGQGETALRVWKRLGNRIELGRFALPEGSYDSVKVRLAEHPIAVRGASVDDPGMEETIWIERLSPCHGIVRSALYQDLGVDFGDVVLFDGAPITHHTYGETRVPVFPHLVTLRRSGYRILPFVGTQREAGAIESLSEKLPEDAVLYSHTEKFVVMCAHCWTSEKTDHRDHRAVEHHVIRGMLCAPPTVSPAALGRALDDAVASAPNVRAYVPALWELVGDHARAMVEARRMAMIEG